MLDTYSLLERTLIAVAAGYLLGAIPFAHLAARLKGVDIFATGNTLAGTANVFWNVGHRTGAVVFVMDVAKGAGAVLLAESLSVPPPLMLVAGGAAVVGHWKSVFTSFRGGDGMAPLMGVTLALVPPLAALGVAAGVATTFLMWGSPLRSTWGIFSCYLVMLGASQYYQLERDLVYGLIVLASMVLLRSMFTRRRRLNNPVLSTAYEDGPDDDDTLDELAEAPMDTDPDHELGATTVRR